MSHYPIPRTSRQAAHQLHDQLHRFLAPLLSVLDQTVDARLVRTFFTAIRAILTFRHRAHGLLLSELGAFIATADHAPAGTKRLSNLLRSSRWTPAVITSWLWQQATARITTLATTADPALLIWDTSVLESSESVHLPDLCAVRSPTAARLKRIKPGFFNPPGGRPICVPGLHWLGLLVVGRNLPPLVATMRWWTTRGDHASTRWAEETGLFDATVAAWGRQVVHVWDRGYASAGWLTRALDADVRFVLRWKKSNKLLNRSGELQKAWESARGKRTWSTRRLYDIHTRQYRSYGVVAMNVTHPDHARPLWLVVARPGQGREPWYLLTSDVVQTAAEAWRVVLSYAQRWQIEQTWRYGKSELAMESPRVWTWERRMKLLLLVTLAYAFLLFLMADALGTLRTQVLRLGCHRTGRHLQHTALPLYRLRAAISHLWLIHRPLVASLPTTPG